MGVKIVTDSTSYIDEKTRKDLDIGILSLAVTFEDGSINETDIDNEDFYKKMDREGIPFSTQPSLGEVYQKMLEVVAKGDDLLCVFISSAMSGTYNTACTVREKILEEYKDAKIFVLDSKSNCMQLGFAAIVAARAAKAGKTIEEVVKIAKDNIKRSRFVFVPNNLEYLKKGGRIGGAGALIGDILKIIPVLTVKNGTTDILRKVRTKARAVKAMIDQVMEDNAKYTIKEIMVHHINCYEESQELSSKLKGLLSRDIGIVDIGPVIGMHVGPGTVGIAYYTEDEMLD